MDLQLILDPLLAIAFLFVDYQTQIAFSLTCKKFYKLNPEYQRRYREYLGTYYHLRNAFEQSYGFQRFISRLEVPKFPNYSRELTPEIRHSNDIWRALGKLFQPNSSLYLRFDPNIPKQYTDKVTFLFSYLVSNGVLRFLPEGIDTEFLVTLPVTYSAKIPWCVTWPTNRLHQRLLASTDLEEIKYLNSMDEEIPTDPLLVDKLKELGIYYTTPRLLTSKYSEDEVLFTEFLSYAHEHIDDFDIEAIIDYTPGHMINPEWFDKITDDRTFIDMVEDGKYELTEHQIARYTLFRIGEKFELQNVLYTSETSCTFLIACALKRAGSKETVKFEDPRYTEYYEKLKKVPKLATLYKNNQFNVEIYRAYEYYRKYDDPQDSYLDYYTKSIAVPDQAPIGTIIQSKCFTTESSYRRFTEYGVMTENGWRFTCGYTKSRARPGKHNVPDSMLRTTFIRPYPIMTSHTPYEPNPDNTAPEIGSWFRAPVLRSK